MATITAYKFEEKIYTDWDALCEAVMESHPELLDDSLVEFIESEVEEFDGIVCDMCGSRMGLVPALTEQHLCSWRCWRELYGEP